MGNENSKNLNLDLQRQMYNDDTNVKLTNSAIKLHQSTVVKETPQQELERLQNSLKLAQREISYKNTRIEELQREVDKLKSVLDQTFPENSDPENESFKRVKRSKRLGVSGESYDVNATHDLIRCPKSFEVKKAIRKAIMQNHLLSKLDQSQVNEIIECMHERHAVENCYIIREGDEGQHIYVSLSGEFEVYKDGSLIGKMCSGKCFGELALLYNCKRTASVKALKTCSLWVLERNIFQTIMMKTGIERQKDLRNFLESVPLFKHLSEAKLGKITQLLETQTYSDGQYIIRQGEQADSFFIIRSGWVKVTQRVNDAEIPIREMTTGEYFGEKALLETGIRTANIFAINGSTEVLCLYREGFCQLIGDLNELQKKEYGDEARVRSYQSQVSMNSDETVSDTLKNLSIKDFEVIATLGIGGFGRVELVANKREPNISYALKCMKKHYIIQTKQQDHVLSEKKILFECHSPFICRLFATFHDNKFVYLLTEACLGGELWTVLRDRIHFEDYATQFCLACVLQGLEYLHSRGIVYRDLKPENLLIGNNGYLKMCDFGFAKKIGLGKRTWTFCGTPEYVAPEIILNKSHDFSADYWSVGILTFELLNGSPPFIANDAMKIYHLTLKGIEASNLHHNRKITPKAANFILKLCRFHPIERLGNGKNGFEDIRNHKYFQGFDWESFKVQGLVSPLEPKLNGPKDTANFDKFSVDPDIPPDELSGWDKEF